MEGMAKTNNAVDGWHNSFEHELGASYPAIWKLIDGLKREQSLQELRIEQCVGGYCTVFLRCMEPIGYSATGPTD